MTKRIKAAATPFDIGREVNVGNGKSLFERERCKQGEDHVPVGDRTRTR
jgi:hypothetical protein